MHNVVLLKNDLFPSSQMEHVCVALMCHAGINDNSLNIQAYNRL